MQWVDLYLECAFVSSLAAAIALLAYRLMPLLGLADLPIPSRTTAMGVVLLVLAGPAALAALLRGVPNRRRAAADADGALRLDERLATALEHPGSRFAPLLWRDTAPRLDGRAPEQVYPVPRLGYRAGAVFAMLALALVVLAPTGLTWEHVREHPLSVVGLDDPPAPPPVVAPKPELKIEAVPREGDAPLKVYFLGFARGAQPAEWEWDFGDGTVVTGERQQEHVYEQPGKYTIELRAAGGEVIERDMIEVRAPDESGGAGGVPLMPEMQPQNGGNSGAQSQRPPVETRPENVTPFDDGKSELVEKERSVYTPGPGGADTPPTPEEFAKRYEEYRRVAEEALGRERIPAPMADFVRAYFDRIRP